MNKTTRSAALTLACLACLSPVAAQEIEEINQIGEPPAMVEIAETDQEQAIQPEVSEEMDASVTEQLDEGGVESIGVDETGQVVADEGAQQVAPASQRAYDVKLRLTLRTTYDDNIFIRENAAESDLITSITPGITVAFGDVGKKDGAFLAFSYSANAFFFLDHSELNSVDHNAAISGQWTGAKLTVAGFVEFHDLTGTNNETSDRVNRKTYESGVSATYAYSDKTTLGTELSGLVSDYETQLDSEQAELRLFADYAVTVRTKMGVGVTLGQVEVEEGTSQTFEQLLARVTYAAGSKLDLTFKGGGELRQVEDGRSITKPVFSLQAIWSPYELLKVRLDGYRRVQPSIIDAGSNTVITGVGVNVSYRFLARFELALTGAYERASYESVSEESSTSREDDYFLGRVGLGYPLTANIQLGTFYQFRTNASTANGRSFDNNQAGLEVSIAF